MTVNIEVTCLLNRIWDPETKEYSGEECNGTLIEISVENVQEVPNHIIPVGIVVLDDGSFQSVPLDFIKKR